MNGIDFQNKLDENEVTTDLGSRIDIVFSNYEYVYTGVYESLFSYHKPLFCEILCSENTLIARKNHNIDSRNNHNIDSRNNQNIDSSNNNFKSVIYHDKKITYSVKKNEIKRTESPQRCAMPIILKNRIHTKINGSTYTLDHNCAFDSITFGIKFVMKNFIFRNFVEQNYKHNFVKSLTTNIETNMQSIVNFYLKANIINKPSNGVLQKSMPLLPREFAASSKRIRFFIAIPRTCYRRDIETSSSR
jgi:hypothetical protein